MALQYWLPLIKDANNQGLTQATFTNTNVVFTGDGKLGKSAVFNGSNAKLHLDNVTLGNVWSVCWWAKASTLHSGYMFQLGNNASSSYVQIAMRTVVENANQVLYLVNKTGGTKTLSVDTRNWNHYCMICDGTNTAIYINGIKEFEAEIAEYYSGNRLSIGCYYSGSFFNGLIQDFRLYDHVLSPREVKEISKGLVLHYTLSNGGGDNLHKYSYNLGSTWVKDNCTVADGVATLTYSGSGNCRIYQMPASGGWTWQANTTYTASIEAKSSNNAKLNITPVGATGVSGYTMDVSSDWKRYSYIFTTKSSVGTGSMSYYATQANTTLQLRRPKLELGDRTTPWIPNLVDPEYTNMGLNSNIEYDVSGFCNNGTKVGTISYEVDTPKYWTSTYFNGGDNAITVPFNTIISNSSIPFTINLWFKKTELGTDNYETLFGGPSGFEMDTRAGSSTTLALYMASTRGNTLYAPFNLNEWYMVTMASDRTNEYYYVNGELVKTIEAKIMPTGDYFIGAWKVYSGQNIKGYISDFRIYATALSADDIKELYNTPISLASNGTLLASGEYTEV